MKQFLKQFRGQLDRELSIYLPAESHQRYAPELAENVLGRPMRMSVRQEGDESPAMMADYLITNALVDEDGKGLHLTLTPVADVELP